MTRTFTICGMSYAPNMNLLYRKAILAKVSSQKAASLAANAYHLTRCDVKHVSPPRSADPLTKGQAISLAGSQLSAVSICGR